MIVQFGLQLPEAAVHTYAWNVCPINFLPVHVSTIIVMILSKPSIAWFAPFSVFPEV